MRCIGWWILTLAESKAEHLKEENKIKHLRQNMFFQKKIIEDFCFSFAHPLVSSYVKWDKMHPHYLCLCNNFSHCSEPAGDI